MRPAEAAEALIRAPQRTVREILLQPSAMPEWNPAFRAIEVPGESSVEVAVRYALRTTLGLSGEFWYDAISEDRVAMSWTVPGFVEHGTWALRRGRGGTTVAHEFSHAGPLAALLRSAYRGVADLRLQRLAARAAPERIGKVPPTRDG